MTLYSHVPHPHRRHRAEQGPVTVAGPPRKSPVARFNTRAAVVVTRAVGTMYCAYLFTLLALYGLPAALHNGPGGFVQWASSQFIQLVLLPVIIVGGAVLAEATDRMSRRQFDDVEALLHGQDEQARHLAAQDEKILAVLTEVQGLSAHRGPGASAAGQLTRLEAAASRLEQALNGHAGAIRDQLASVRVDASAAHAGIQALSDMIATIPQAAPEPPSAVPPAAGGGTAGGEPAPAARRSPTEPRERM